jgi:predicted RNase H-like nuclease (RuvC/YqgF family)
MGNLLGFTNKNETIKRLKSENEKLTREIERLTKIVSELRIELNEQKVIVQKQNEKLTQVKELFASTFVI